MRFRTSLLAAAGRFWGVPLVVVLIGGCGAPTSTPTPETDGAPATPANATTDAPDAAPTYQPSDATNTGDSGYAAAPDLGPNVKPLQIIPTVGSESAAEGRENWISDFAAAKTQAADEGKDILMDFTGSDWCSWCIRLKDEVFRHTEFTEYATENFVLLELDFPRDKSRLSAETQAQNAELQIRFPIDGYPTILLTDAEGRPYARTGYQQGGPAKYVEHLEQLKAARKVRDTAFEAAQQLAGVERAKKLSEGLEAVPAQFIATYESELAEIINLDDQNQGGLRQQYESQQKQYRDRVTGARFQQEFTAIMEFADSTRDVDASLKKIEELESNPEFANYEFGLMNMKLMRLQLLQNGKRMDDLLALADEYLADAEIPAEVRFKVYLAKLGGLQQSNRIPDAIEVVDALLKEFSEDSGLATQLYLQKADFLGQLNRKDEAVEILNQARKVADQQMLPAIDQFEKNLLQGNPGTGAEAAPATEGQSEK